MHQDRSALTASQLAYDGPLPTALREAIRNGGIERCNRLQRESESRHLDRCTSACRARIAASRSRPDPQAMARALACLRARGTALRAGLMR